MGWGVKVSTYMEDRLQGWAGDRSKLSASYKSALSPSCLTAGHCHTVGRRGAGHCPSLIPQQLLKELYGRVDPSRREGGSGFPRRHPHGCCF